MARVNLVGDTMKSTPTVSRRNFVKLSSAAGLVSIAGLAGCGSSSSASTTSAASSSSSASTFKIGHIGPLTGAGAVYGENTQNAAELAIKEINALGGSVQFEFLSEDDEMDAEKAVNAYNQLKDWGVQAVIGPVTSTAFVAASAETSADNVFNLAPAASSLDCVGGEGANVARKANVFQVCFTDPNQGTAAAQYIAKQNMATKIAIIYKNDDVYSTGVYTNFAAEAANQGLEIVSTSTFTDDSASDFSVQLNDAKYAGADLVFLPIYFTPASLILTQANAMGYAPKFFGVDGLDGILTQEGFDTSLAEGVMLLTPFVATATDEVTQSFVKGYKEAYGDTPLQFAADAYDCVYIIKALIEKTGVTPDMSASDICDKLAEAIVASDFSYSGVTGENMTWSEDGTVTKEPKGMIIENGEYQPLD